MSTVAIETKRAIALGSKKSETGFKGLTPMPNRSSLKSGDVVTIPADYEALEASVRGAKARVNPKTGQKEQPKMKFCFVDVVRGGKHLVVQFFPSCFWKRREEAELSEEDSTIWVGTGRYQSASGDAAEFIQGFADLDEAMHAIAGKPFEVTVSPVFKALDYAEEGKVATTASDCTVYELNFVEEDVVKE